MNAFDRPVGRAWEVARGHLLTALAQGHGFYAVLAEAGPARSRLLDSLGRALAREGHDIRRVDGREATATSDGDVLLIDEADALDPHVLMRLSLALDRSCVLAAAPGFADRLLALPNGVGIIRLNLMQEPDVTRFGDDHGDCDDELSAQISRPLPDLVPSLRPTALAPLPLAAPPALADASSPIEEAVVTFEEVPVAPADPVFSISTPGGGELAAPLPPAAAATAWDSLNARHDTESWAEERLASPAAPGHLRSAGLVLVLVLGLGAGAWVGWQHRQSLQGMLHGWADHLTSGTAGLASRT